MASPSELLTAGKIAQQLSASGSDVKKAIQSLKLKPALVKGGCSYYAADSVGKIKKQIAKG